MLRPRPCAWFELIAARATLAPVLEALAQSGAVELQAHDAGRPPLVIADVAPLLERYRALARGWQLQWARWAPPAAWPGSEPVADPAARLAHCIAVLEAWCHDAAPWVGEDEDLQAQARQLDDLAGLLEAAAPQLPPPALLAAAGRFRVGARAFALASPLASPHWPAGVLVLPLAAGAATFLLLVGRVADLDALADTLAAQQARRIEWPADLGGDAAAAAREVAARRAALQRRRDAGTAQLRALAQAHGLARALADIAVVEWLLQHGPQLGASERLVWVSGWTRLRDAAALRALFDAKGLNAVVRLAPPPPGAEAPSTLSNPRWARAFEVFARLLGQPGRDESDPSVALALIAPLLFGFMFGDVGQGAVLVVAGWLLRRRVPALALLMPGGAMAIVFGLLFGSVFAREDLIPALWLHPLQAPVTLLAAAVGLGALVLLLGLALQALQAHWRGAGAAWWARDAGLVLAYAACLALLRWPAAAAGVAAGALWFVGGAAALSRGGARAALMAAAAALARFVEQGLQLLVNTVSFARVGAFALAHAGLSAAVVGIAEAAGPVGQAVVLLLGNLLILVLEGMVVGIQTTRLMLFEFFVRFLEGHGRALRPLLPPRLPIAS